MNTRKTFYSITAIYLLVLGWCGVEDKKGKHLLGLMPSQAKVDDGSDVYRRVGIFIGGERYTMSSRWARSSSIQRVRLV
jgi:hypothetical protein